MARCTPASHPDRWCFEAGIEMVLGIAGTCGVILVVLSLGSGECCWQDPHGGSSLLHIFGLRERIYYRLVSGLFDGLWNILT